MLGKAKVIFCATAFLVVVATIVFRTAVMAAQPNLAGPTPTPKPTATLTMVSATKPVDIPIGELAEAPTITTDVPIVAGPTSKPVASPTSEPTMTSATELVETEATAYQAAAIGTLPESGMMFLTFDDGWGRENIRRILDALREHQVPATFFVIGHRLKAYPDLWRQAIGDGHEIAYHSMTHAWLADKDDAWIAQDVDAWEQTAKAVLGDDYVIPKIARLPGGSGHRTARALGLFNDMGYTVVGWSADTLAGTESNDPREIARYVLAHSREGAILLQHFTERDSKSLPLYLKALKERALEDGFALGKVSDGLAVSAGR